MTCRFLKDWRDLELPKAHRLTAVTGAGGKTSLIRWLASCEQARSRRVVITTTTKMFPDSRERTVLAEDGPDFTGRLGRALDACPRVVAAQRLDRATGKLIGLDPAVVTRLHLCRVADTIIVEADGAARKPLKAPNATEPVIPEGTGQCIAVMGLDAAYRPLTDTMVHRPELFSRITGLALHGAITPRHMIHIATAPDGLLKGCPRDCDRAVFLNKTDILGGSRLVDEFRDILSFRADTRNISWFSGSVWMREADMISRAPLPGQGLPRAGFEFSKKI